MWLILIVAIGALVGFTLIALGLRDEQRNQKRRRGSWRKAGPESVPLTAGGKGLMPERHVIERRLGERRLRKTPWTGFERRSGDERRWTDTTAQFKAD